jgi:aspartate/methionine/tyrosine aminotransferase
MSEPAFPLDRQVVDAVVAEHGISLGSASIREVNRVINAIETRFGCHFIRMEFGIPGLPANPVAIEAEIEALRDRNLANVYSPFDGIPALKNAAAEFTKAFLGFSVPPHCCVPTVGAMQGCFISMGISGYRFADRDTILFLDPGFPVNKLQCQVWGLKREAIDFHSLRGPALIDALEEKFATGKVGGLIYSNPNNPTWVCFKEQELEGIAKLLTKYDVIGMEDLAYFGMDFRHEYGIPYQPPYQPTIANYTNNYILIISSSKIFSYAGQRVAISVISPELFEAKSPDLLSRFGTDRFGHAFVHGGMYTTTAGVPVGPQHGLTALLKAAIEQDPRFTEPVREYALRAKEMKTAFLENGFDLVYDNDLGEPIADGFYFTVRYADFHCTKLLEELAYYGVSAIGLNTAGSEREEGIRACVSLTPLDRIGELRERLAAFDRDHS